MRAALMWGLPSLSFVIVGFAPAAIQLSFAVASFLSMGTSIMFRSPAMRKFFRMELQPVNPTTASPIPHTGRVIDTTAEGKLTLRAEEGTSDLFRQNREDQDVHRKPTTQQAARQHGLFC